MSSIELNKTTPMLKRLLLAALLLPGIANAQFVNGQVLTATQLDNAFAATLSLAGGTLTGPLTVPSLSVTGTPIPLASGGTNAVTAAAALANLGGAPIASPTFTGTVSMPGSQVTGTSTVPGSLSIQNQVISETATLGYGSTSWSPYELEISNNASGNNVFHVLNNNSAGFSAISYRGTDAAYNPSPSAINEHLALGWSNSGSVDFLEFSNYNATNAVGYAPSHAIFQQTGGVDPTGGVALQCSITSGSTSITCAAAVPAASGTLYVEGYGILDNTQIASGGGTTTPTLTQAATATNATATIRFWTPTYAQYQFFSAERDNQVYFNNWDGSQAIVVNRATASKQVGIYGGQLASSRQITGSATTDTATVHDRFVLWNSTATSGKSESIPGCTTPALVAAGAVSTAGQVLTILDEAATAGAYAITVTPATGQVNFGSSVAINQNSGSLTLTCDGQGNWASANPWTGTFSALSASGAVSGTGFSNYLASPPAIGGTTAAAGTFTNLTASSGNVNGSLSIFSNLVLANVAPTIASGFGTSPSIGSNTGAIGFKLVIGTGGMATSGVLTMPTASHGWNCNANDVTTQSSTVFSTKMTASTTTSATLTNFNTSGAAAAWTAGDTLVVSCVGF